jgi:hypothetical protein
LRRAESDIIVSGRYGKETVLKVDRAFKNAFLEGLAAPVSLFSTPGSYISAAVIPTPAQSFAGVGIRLTAMMGASQDDRQPGPATQDTA